MSFPADDPNQKTHGRKEENSVSKLPEVNCLNCDLGNDFAFDGTRVFPHECGNYEHDCPIFQAFKSRLMTPKIEFCPFCNLLNDGQWSHFDTSHGYRPAIKVCRRCNTFGQHWSKDCPNVVRDNNGHLHPLMYCRICQSCEHRSTQCPKAAASSFHGS